MHNTVNLYFVASPLQYLAAKAIAGQSEAGSRQVLIWYKKGVAPIVRQDEWDAASYMPWPRFEPLPGRFGRHKRLIENIEMVAKLAGQCKTLRIHSAVFDTEAINYFLCALPTACGAKKMSARILPDGVISIRRYPLSFFKRMLQYTKRLRRFADRRLDYWTFKGDRIGSDAPFCDRIYVIPGFPHEYPEEKTVILPPLLKKTDSGNLTHGKRALIVGQPLVGAGLIRKSALPDITQKIFDWLQSEAFDVIDYKGHPKDPNRELYLGEYNLLQLDEALESWMSKTNYDAVLGVRSSALLFAIQIYPADTRVIAFGWDEIKFKSKAEQEDMRNLFTQCGIQLR